METVKPENREEKDQIHGCPVTASCMLGCTQDWPAGCLTLNQDLREQPLWPLEVPFIGEIGVHRVKELAVIHC